MTALRPFGITGFRKCLPVMLLLAVGFMTKAQEIPLTVIGNVTGVPSAMKYSELISVLKGEKQRWSDGTKVNIYIMKTTTPIGQTTCKKIYNWSGDKVKRYWLELSFSGKADAPTFCNTVEELETYLKVVPTAPDADNLRKVIEQSKRALGRE